MSRANQTATLCLSTLTGLAAVTALVATGWTLDADARQGSRRPYIPRPSDIRPLQQPQAPLSRASAQQPAGQSAPTRGAVKPDDQKSKQAGFDGEDYSYDVKTTIMTARDFVYKEDDMTVTGAKARYNKSTRTLDAEGRLVLDDPKHHMTGDKARYDNHPNVKLAIFTGSVVIVMKPKDKPATDNTDDVDKEKNRGATAYCDRLDYFKIKDVAILTGHLVFKQKIDKQNGKSVERTLTAEHAEYDGKVDKMHLFAPVDLTDTDDQKAHFDKDVFVGTRAGQETVESKGRFSATINVDDDENSAKPESKPGDKQPTGAGKAPEPVRQDPPPVVPDKKQDPPVKKNP